MCLHLVRQRRFRVHLGFKLKEKTGDTEGSWQEFIWRGFCLDKISVPSQASGTLLCVCNPTSGVGSSVPFPPVIPGPFHTWGLPHRTAVFLLDTLASPFHSSLRFPGGRATGILQNWAVNAYPKSTPSEQCWELGEMGRTPWQWQQFFPAILRPVGFKWNCQTIFFLLKITSCLM